MKAAIASSDGVNVDAPWGRAEKFYIYALEGGARLEEVRNASKAGHIRRIEIVRDCSIVLAPKIGPVAAESLFLSGVYPIELSGPIAETLNGIMTKKELFTIEKR